jgi:hypothetical protein
VSLGIKPEVLNLLLDVNLSELQIHILPPEPDDLSPPQPCIERYGPHRRPGILAKTLQEVLGLGYREKIILMLVLHRSHQPTTRIFLDQLIVDGLAEGGRQ